jgi:hypothetical protein
MDSLLFFLGRPAPTISTYRLMTPALRALDVALTAVREQTVHADGGGH